MTTYERYILAPTPHNKKIISKYHLWGLRKKEKKILEDIYKEESSKIIQLQIKTKLTYIHDPQIRWNTIFDPIIDEKTGILKKYLSYNKLYYSPNFQTKIRYKMGRLSKMVYPDLMPRNKKWSISLPGPYTIYTVYKTNSIDADENKIKKITLKIIEEALNNEYDLIILHEPALTYNNIIDQYLVKRLYKELIETLNTFRVHIPRGELGIRLGTLIDIAPHGFTLDIYNLSNDIREMPIDLLGIGIIDSHNPKVEDPIELSKFIERIVDRLKPKIVYLTPNDPLNNLTYKISEEKIFALGRLMRGDPK